jgi:CRISPR-associated endonuclease/helicase Cas3
MLYGSVLSGALVFDEFHLLEPEKSLQTALHLLRKSPWPVLIMTATMSRTLRSELCDILEAEEVVVGEDDLPHIRSQHETVKHVTVEDETMSGAVLADELGERTLVICNRVKRAQEVYEALDETLTDRDDDRERMLLHSRFLPKDRAEKETSLRKWFKEESQERAVLVATQVVEAGLDISCDVMHTEVSPVDSFLQRIGRSARFEGEREASIHVYPLEDMDEQGSFLPYRKETTLRTLEALPEYEEKGLRFEDTQGLIDDILTEAHEDIVQTYRQGEVTRADEIERVRKTGDYAGNKTLVRFIDNVEIVVAEQRAVEEEGASPFAYPAVSIPTGTFRGYLRGEDGRTFVVDEFTDEAGQEQDGKYFTLLPLGPSDKEWPSRRFVIPPSHAAYDETLGLRLETTGARTFEPDDETASYPTYRYEKEEYKDHIRRLYEQGELREASLAALRRLSASEAHPHIDVRDPERVIDVVIWAHDLAKLSDGWQAAHGDEDLPLAHGGREHRPPPHAGESACAVVEAVPTLLPNETEDTWTRVIRAIRTHHSPRAKAYGAYHVAPERRDYLRRVTPELRAPLVEVVEAAWDDITWHQPDGDEDPHWPDRDAGPEGAPVYALLAYMLRRSDQLATSEVSSSEEKEKSSSGAMGVSNFL